MSIFDDNDEDVKNSIRFFNRLSNESQIRIVSDLNPNTLQQKQQYKSLFALLSKIQKDISKYDAIKIGNKLMELGLNETYARLFVANVKNHAPTEAYQLTQLDKIQDEDFVEKLPNIMKDVWVNNELKEVLVERYGIDEEKIQCIINLTGQILDDLSCGITTKEILIEKCKPHISEEKITILINQIFVYRKHWYDTTLFSSVREMSLNMPEFARQNREMLRLLQELVDLKKKENE